jgi:hypothetical protein
MLRPRAFLLVLLAAICSGCVVTSAPQFVSYEVYVVAPRTGVATGVTATVGISIRETSHEDWGGYGAGPQVPTLSVDHVSCSPDCVAKRNSTSSYDVSATTPGPRRVELAFSTSDGKSSVETATVDFRDPTRIEARRGGTSPSGSAYAMVPGDGQWWHVSVADAKGPLLVDLCQPSVTGAGAVEVDSTRCNQTIGVSAVAPGSGTVTMSFGSLVRTETITVIDPANIRQVELREVLIASDASVAIESLDGVLAPLHDPVVITSCWQNGSRSIVPQLTTADGTIALGAADLLGAIPSSVGLEVNAQVVEVTFEKVASGTLRGNFGSSAGTTLSVPFVAESDPACPR